MGRATQRVARANSSRRAFNLRLRGGEAVGARGYIPRVSAIIAGGTILHRLTYMGLFESY